MYMVEMVDLDGGDGRDGDGGGERRRSEASRLLRSG